MLPDMLVPYKQYREETVSGVLDGTVSPGEEDSENYPSEQTMVCWHHCFMAYRLISGGQVKALV